VVLGMLTMRPCPVRKGAIREWAGLRGDQSFCTGCCAGAYSAILTRFCADYGGTAGKITKEAGSGNLRSAPAVWRIYGRPVLDASMTPRRPAMRSSSARRSTSSSSPTR
jgi:hypothetical protein